MRGKKIRISKCISAHSSGKHWQNSVFESITEENKTKITKILSVIVAVLSKVPELVSRLHRVNVIPGKGPTRQSSH